MSKVFFSIFFLCFAAAVISLQATENSLDRPGYCLYHGIYIKEGEQVPGPIGECTRIKCVSALPGAMKISGVGCGTFQPRPGCHVSEYDYTKPYPECCPDEIC